MKDELETEVNRKIEKMHSQQIEEDDDYEDEMTYQQDENKSFEILKEDTIKTDKINEIMEEEDKLREQDKFILEQNEYERDLDNVDIVEDLDKSR